MKPSRIDRLCEAVGETGRAIHHYHRSGHAETVYGQALHHRLRKQGLDVQSRHALPVLDEDGTPLGVYVADLWIEHCLPVKLMACRQVRREDLRQLLGCLRSARMEAGLLLNFGAPTFYRRKLLLEAEPVRYARLLTASLAL